MGRARSRTRCSVVGHEGRSSLTRLIWCLAVPKRHRLTSNGRGTSSSGPRRHSICPPTRAQRGPVGQVLRAYTASFAEVNAVRGLAYPRLHPGIGPASSQSRASLGKCCRTRSPRPRPLEAASDDPGVGGSIPSLPTIPSKSWNATLLFLRAVAHRVPELASFLHGRFLDLRS